MSTELPDPVAAAREYARELVRTGFETRAYIVQSVGECMEEYDDEGLDAIVINTSGCGTMLSRRLADKVPSTGLSRERSASITWAPMSWLPEDSPLFSTCPSWSLPAAWSWARTRRTRRRRWR